MQDYAFHITPYHEFHYPWCFAVAVVLSCVSTQLTVDRSGHVVITTVQLGLLIVSLWWCVVTTTVITISLGWGVVIAAVQLRLFAGLGNASHSFNCSKFRLRGSLLFQGFQRSHARPRGFMGR